MSQKGLCGIDKKDWRAIKVYILSATIGELVAAFGWMYLYTNYSAFREDVGNKPFISTISILSILSSGAAMGMFVGYSVDYLAQKMPECLNGVNMKVPRDWFSFKDDQKKPHFKFINSLISPVCEKDQKNQEKMLIKINNSLPL